MENNIRQQIVELLSQPQTTTNLYDEMKCCLIVKTHEVGDMSGFGNIEPKCNIHSIDEWFFGVIQSLFYKPNRNLLLLVGNPGIGKSEFLRRLFPQKEMFVDTSSSYDVIKKFFYEKLIIDFDAHTEVSKSALKTALASDGFKIIEGNLPVCEKRLASFCSTSNTPPRSLRSTIVLQLESIDKIRFNSIDKLKLWIEIFHRFTPKVFENKEAVKAAFTNPYQSALEKLFLK